MHIKKSLVVQVERNGNRNGRAGIIFLLSWVFIQLQLEIVGSNRRVAKVFFRVLPRARKAQGEINVKW